MEMELFQKEEGEGQAVHEPLASRMRPRNLEEFVGQKHILAPGRLLYRAIKADRVGSIILYGPAGCGKTALAGVISMITRCEFDKVSAVGSNVEGLRSVIAMAKHRLATSGKKTILFIDEIHRFNKAQQDVLLPHVEKGTVSLIGATTHNPFFSINSPLLSRAQVFRLNPLSPEEVEELLERAISDKERGLGDFRVRVDKEALRHMANKAGGDARRALNALEIGVLTTEPAPDGVIRIDISIAEDSMQVRHVDYDRDEDGHYDTISAFIKSMRGSDPDAALFWLAKMIHAGESPSFIARRIVICASEDVGNADPRALMVAQSAFQAAEFIGMPEARIPLAQAAIYVSTAPKSNASYEAIEKAISDVENVAAVEVPAHLRDTGYPGAEKLGHGRGYRYPHGEAGGYVPQAYRAGSRTYYRPSGRGYEKSIKERLDHWKRLKAKKESGRI